MHGIVYNAKLLEMVSSMKNIPKFKLKSSGMYSVMGRSYCNMQVQVRFF